MVLERFVAVLLAPLLFLQGRRVRKVTPRLPEVQDQRTGSSAPRERYLRLLVLGDSAAAGVGVARFEDTLAGQLVSQLEHDQQVSWHVVAKTGWTAANVLRALDRLGYEPFDAVVISLGVNDVTSLSRNRDFVARYMAILERLRANQAAQVIVASGRPPVGQVPALPQPLRWVLGRRARRFDAALQIAIRDEHRVVFQPQTLLNDPALMASDGYHPGPVVYAVWASEAARLIRSALA
jgi:lysophospholipase L1-like esterase